MGDSENLSAFPPSIIKLITLFKSNSRINYTVNYRRHKSTFSQATEGKRKMYREIRQSDPIKYLITNYHSPDRVDFAFTFRIYQCCNATHAC